VAYFDCAAPRTPPKAMSERFRRSFSAGARRPLKLSPAAEAYGEGLGGTRAAQRFDFD